MTGDVASAEPEATGRATSELGVFVFLASEGLLFGALLLVYFIDRLQNGSAFVAGSRELSLLLGTTNTAVLLSSSFVAALATSWGEAGRSRPARVALVVTAALGACFLGIKAYEYLDEASRHLLPVFDLAFAPPGDQPQATERFFSVYLALTGTHALHLLTGMVLMLSLAAVWSKLRRPANVLRLAALYWHFIDVIWVVLFPILYLVR